MSKIIFWVSIVLIIVGIAGLLWIEVNPQIDVFSVGAWDLVLWGAIVIGVPPAVSVCTYWLAWKYKGKRLVKGLFVLLYIAALAIFIGGVAVLNRAHRYCCCDMQAWTGMGGGFLGLFFIAFGLYSALCITIAVMSSQN